MLGMSSSSTLNRCVLLLTVGLEIGLVKASAYVARVARLGFELLGVISSFNFSYESFY